MKHRTRALADRLRGLRPTGSLDEHLQSALDWICAAHDASQDDGVPHSYDLRLRGWLPSYPETTGYIIPTLFDAAALMGRPELAQRAIRMARWEASIQFPDGGIQAGMIGADPLRPTIFNTGQVLFGFVRAYQETGDAAMGEAARKAADWLVAAQDADGCWRRFKSPFTTTEVATYNTRSAFALARAWEVLGDRSHLEAAVRNAEWAVAQARPNRWLPGNSLDRHDDDRALTHTIAYSIRGIFEVGVCAGREDLVAFARGMAESLAAVQRADGALPGYISPAWKPLASWSCVTGNAQMALNWQRVAHVCGDPRAIEWAKAANRFNMGVQHRTASDVGIRGAMPGSFPFDGGYMTWRFPNWATKFFVDALLLERHGKAAGNAGA